MTRDAHLERYRLFVEGRASTLKQSREKEKKESAADKKRQK
jgi:hypothetical protein